MERTPQGWIAPVRSVGVQGDARSYRAVLILYEPPSEEALRRATRLANEIGAINRVVARVAARLPLDRMEVTRGFLSSERLERLRAADAVVRRLARASGFEREVWQFPVVLIPLGDGHAPDSVVLRPIHSVDGMTARPVLDAARPTRRSQRRTARDRRRVRGILRPDQQTPCDDRVGIATATGFLRRYLTFAFARRRRPRKRSFTQRLVHAIWDTLRSRKPGSLRAMPSQFETSCAI